jgi:microcystin-dependent protein
MPYIVNFTDKENKTPITVFDNTSNTDTSLVFPGRNVTGYGQIIAENFLSLLENFASGQDIPPVNPIEGQLWYNSTTGVLNIWDNVAWRAASGIQQGATEPATETSKVGELWVDTTNQQLRIFSGTRWILVGPSESSIDGLRYGPSVETIADSDNVNRSILTFYIADVPVIIFSKDSFTPKIGISGYPQIKAGINLNVPSTSSEISQFIGGLLPKLYGTALEAESLKISDEVVPAGRFLRTDKTNTTEFGLNIRNNNGITLGLDGTFNISNSAAGARIYNSASGSTIDLQTNRNGIPSTILRVFDNKVSINKAVPDQELDVDGNIALTGSLIVTNNVESTNLNNGSIRTAGGVAISKNLLIGTTLDVTGTTSLSTLQPRSTDAFDCGTSARRWNTVRAKKVIAEEIEGILNGNINGNANTATNLKNVTTFKLQGDVISQDIPFDGQVGSATKIFNTQLTSNIISNRSEPFPNISRKGDFVLTYRASESTAVSGGLLKQTREAFVADLGIPIGAILPFAGNNVPYGFLLCDGSEVERARFPDLFDIIGTTYNRTTFRVGTLITGFVYTIEILGTTDFTAIGATSNEVGVTFTATGLGAGTGSASTTQLFGVGTYRVPDLRGRFPLGKDNMDNGLTVPTSIGSYIDAGGGNVDRVPDTKADILGGDAGQSSVSLTLANLPDHTHTMTNESGVQYSAIRVDTAINPPATTGLGPTAPGQAQYFNSTGTVRKPDPSFTLSTPIGTMNPYLTINYIIRSGPPVFTATV